MRATSRTGGTTGHKAHATANHASMQYAALDYVGTDLEVPKLRAPRFTMRRLLFENIVQLGCIDPFVAATRPRHNIRMASLWFAVLSRSFLGADRVVRTLLLSHAAPLTRKSWHRRAAAVLGQEPVPRGLGTAGVGLLGLRRIRAGSLVNNLSGHNMQHVQLTTTQAMQAMQTTIASSPLSALAR